MTDKGDGLEYRIKLADDAFQFMQELSDVEQEFLAKKLFELAESPHSMSRPSRPPHEYASYQIYETSMPHSQRSIMFLVYFVYGADGKTITVDLITRREQRRDK